MNTIGIALVWCIVQVTLLGVLSAALYLIAQRIRPGAGAPIALTGLSAVVVLSALALSPWPRWTWDVAATSSAVADGNVAQPPSAVGPPKDPTAPSDDPSLQTRAPSPKDSTLSTADSLWRGFLDELSQTQPASGGTTWGWPAVIAVVVLTGMAAGLVWLFLGVLAVRWHRARSRPVEDAGLLALVNQLRAELGCRRPVELRESDDLVTAATIGWLRPCILLPPGVGNLDRGAAPRGPGPRDGPRPAKRFSGRAGRPARRGAPLLSPLAALADGPAAPGTGVGRRRSCCRASPAASGDTSSRLRNSPSASRTGPWPGRPGRFSPREPLS